VQQARRIRLLRAIGAAALATLAPWNALAIEYRSVSEPAAVLHDGPSKDSAKLFVLSRDYPVEIIIATEAWVRVRDDTGAFGWIEAKSLSNRRTVLVKAQSAEVRQAPNENAAVVFKAEAGLVLELQGVTGGWAQVRHRDGASGFLKLSQLWGV
jgi:SH3-like domain-containing protein